MKKLLASLLALVLVFTLVACGGNDKDADKDTGDNNTEETQGDADAPDTTGDVPEIRYLFLAEGEDKEKVEEKVNERLAELDAGYKVKFIIFGWSNYAEKLGLAARGASNDERFDLATTASWLGPFETLVAEETLLPLDPILEEAAPKLAESLSEAQKKGASINGKLYGIQTVIDGVPMARDMFIWNVAQLEAIGKSTDDIKDIDNINDLEPILKEWKEKNPDKYPLKGSKDGTWAERRLGSLIRTHDDGSYEITNYVRSDELKAKFEKMGHYRDEGYIHPDSGTEPFGEQQAEPDEWLVARGEGEPGSAGDWEIQFNTSIYARPIADDNVLYNSNVQGKLTSLYAHTEHPKKALDFIEKVKFDEQIQNLMTWGIEGEHYTIVDGRVEPIAEQKGWNPWRNQFPNDVRALSTTSIDLSTPEMQKRIQEEYLDPIVPSVDLGFQPSPELREKITEMMTKREAGVELQNGHMDIYDLYIRNVNDLHDEEVLNQLKQEFEAWKANQ